MKIKNIFKTPKEHNYFFGYYDKSQLSKNNEFLLEKRAGKPNLLIEND